MWIFRFIQHHKSSATSRKEIRAAEDRLRRQIESDRKDEAIFAMDLCGNWFWE